MQENVAIVMQNCRILPLWCGSHQQYYSQYWGCRLQFKTLQRSLRDEVCLRNMATAFLETRPTSATASVFNEGIFTYKSFNVDTSAGTKPSPPKPLLIFTPTVEGVYPVVLFCHGFYLRNNFYSQLLGHIASHGLIVIAPQYYTWIPIPAPCEVEYAGKITDWLVDGLQPLLPENVIANLEKLVLTGHSRGGKTAFAVALGYAETKLKFSVLVGIDPVAGCSELCRTFPHILTYVPKSFNLSIPVTVIGTGLGPEQASCCSPACAPDGVNHKEFYNECKPTRAHFVATDYGHMDMLDDDPPGLVGGVSNCLCKNGRGPRDLMRRTVAGIVVAFLRAYLDGQSEDFDAIVADPGLAPARLDPVDYEPALSQA